MKVRELIEKLKEFNQEAEVDVIAHNRKYDFSLCWGGSEGCSKQNTDEASFYVDALCVGEKRAK